jgi:hypothetical protein
MPLDPNQHALCTTAMQSVYQNPRKAAEFLRRWFGVYTLRQLTRDSGLRLLAFMETSGFRQPGKPDDYWRNRYLATKPPAERAELEYQMSSHARLGDGESPTPHLDLRDITLFPLERLKAEHEQTVIRMNARPETVAESIARQKAGDFSDYDDPHQNPATYTEAGAAAWRASLGPTSNSTQWSAV